MDEVEFKTTTYLELWSTPAANLVHWPLSHLLSGAAASFLKQAIPGEIR